MWTIIYNFQREDALSRKTVVDSMTDANSENYAVKERQKEVPDQEHGVNTPSSHTSRIWLLFFLTNEFLQVSYEGLYDGTIS